METAELLQQLVQRTALTREQTRGLFDDIMSGSVAPEMLAAVLAALATKGETVDEIVGATEAMRARVVPVGVPAEVDAIDTCGTGGDGKPTFNVSSAVAIVAAAAGATVAKHGNRSNARPSGSAEGLAALGINVDADVATIERCLSVARVAFLYAIKMHPAMKHAAPVRKSLGIRTIFNLVGPLTNPAGVKRQVLGVCRPDLVETMLAALGDLGAERALVVHGLEGLCDLSISGPSRVGRLANGRRTIETVDPESLGITPAPVAELFVRNPQESAQVIEGILDGEPGPHRDVVVFNAAAALWVAGLAGDWRDGATRAKEAIDSGAARHALALWRRTSTGA